MGAVLQGAAIFCGGNIRDAANQEQFKLARAAVAVHLGGSELCNSIQISQHLSLMVRVRGSGFVVNDHFN